MKRSMVDINLASSPSVQSVQQFVTWWDAARRLEQVFPPREEQIQPVKKVTPTLCKKFSYY